MQNHQKPVKKWQNLAKSMSRSAPEPLLSIIILVISLLNCSAMAGVVGGGGLDDLAIRYGYQRFNIQVMIVNSSPADCASATRAGDW